MKKVAKKAAPKKAEVKKTATKKVAAKKTVASKAAGSCKCAKGGAKKCADKPCESSDCTCMEKLMKDIFSRLNAEELMKDYFYTELLNMGVEETVANGLANRLYVDVSLEGEIALDS